MDQQVKELRALGLTHYESRIYAALLLHGRSQAKQIADRTKIGITSVYPNLKSLLNKRLIQEFKGTISVYGPLDPTKTIPSIVMKKRRELESQGKHILTVLESIKNNHMKSEEPKEKAEKINDDLITGLSLYYKSLKDTDLICNRCHATQHGNVFNNVNKQKKLF